MLLLPQINFPPLWCRWVCPLSDCLSVVSTPDTHYSELTPPDMAMQAARDFSGFDWCEFGWRSRRSCGYLERRICCPEVGQDCASDTSCHHPWRWLSTCSMWQPATENSSHGSSANSLPLLAHCGHWPPFPRPEWVPSITVPAHTSGCSPSSWNPQPCRSLLLIDYTRILTQQASVCPFARGEFLSEEAILGNTWQNWLAIVLGLEDTSGLPYRRQVAWGDYHPPVTCCWWLERSPFRPLSCWFWICTTRPLYRSTILSSTR